MSQPSSLLFESAQWPISHLTAPLRCLQGSKIISVCKVKFIILPPKLVLYLCSLSSEPRPHSPTCKLEIISDTPSTSAPLTGSASVVSWTSPPHHPVPSHPTILTPKPLHWLPNRSSRKTPDSSRVAPSKWHSDHLKSFHRESLIVLGPESLPVASRPWGVRSCLLFQPVLTLLSSCMPLLSALCSQGLCTACFLEYQPPTHMHTHADFYLIIPPRSLDFNSNITFSEIPSSIPPVWVRFPIIHPHKTISFFSHNTYESL